MNGFIEWLESLNKQDSKVRAILRRSLSFEPGEFVPAFPYVEPFVKDEKNFWRRKIYYLIAAVWAEHWREGRTTATLPIGKACAAYQRESGSSSTERRFINLLDADLDQLPNRLRQIVALLKEYSIDFDALLKGLLYWNDDQKRTQNNWARDFYRNIENETEKEPIVQKEEN
jgi:CRISPR system Cascade subunit CasB